MAPQATIWVREVRWRRSGLGKHQRERRDPVGKPGCRDFQALEVTAARAGAQRRRRDKHSDQSDGRRPRGNDGPEVAARRSCGRKPKWSASDPMSTPPSSSFRGGPCCDFVTIKEIAIPTTSKQSGPPRPNPEAKPSSSASLGGASWSLAGVLPTFSGPDSTYWLAKVTNEP